MDRYLWGDLAARPLFFPVLALVLGAALSPVGTGSGGWVFLILAALLSAAVLSLARLPGAHLALLLALGGAGAGLGALEARVEVPAGLGSGGSVILEGEIERVDPFEDSTRLHLAVTRAGLKADATAPVRFRASLYVHGAGPTLLPGQRIWAEAKLQPLAPPANPGEKNFTATRKRQAFLFSGSVVACFCNSAVML